eukprot:TRINITY_DN9094_c0_g1_i1.p1 TRINITY_DN9094_c0_g1~~TRINITY_DN9094_c0_g1_i1.p1  ORF type:complete len:167 (+),score=26.40 TRINITY_DN9094_c0_g1_i1:128-628(+)
MCIRDRYSSVQPPIIIPLVDALTTASTTLSTLQKSTGDVIVLYVLETSGLVKIQVYTTVSGGSSSSYKASVVLGEVVGIPAATLNGANPFTWMTESGRRSDATQEEYVLHTEDGSIYVLDLSLIHISEPTRLLSISYAVFCLKKKKIKSKKQMNTNRLKTTLSNSV